MTPFNSHQKQAEIFCQNIEENEAFDYIIASFLLSTKSGFE
jgi:hypothetical protein